MSDVDVVVDCTEICLRGLPGLRDLQINLIMREHGSMRAELVLRDWIAYYLIREYSRTKPEVRGCNNDIEKAAAQALPIPKGKMIYGWDVTVPWDVYTSTATELTPETRESIYGSPCESCGKPIRGARLCRRCVLYGRHE